MQKISRVWMNIYQFDRIRCCTTSIDRIQLLCMSKSEFTAVPKQNSQQQQLKNCVCCLDVMDKNKFNKLSAASLFCCCAIMELPRRLFNPKSNYNYRRMNLQKDSTESQSHANLKCFCFLFLFATRNECKAQSSFSLKYACSTDRVVISQN